MKSKLLAQIKLVETTRLKSGATLNKMSFLDAYRHKEPEIRKSVEEEIYRKLIPAIEEHKRIRGANYKDREDNQVTRDLFAQSAVLDRWRRDMPTAAALYPLQMPHKKQLADGTPFDQAAERYFPHALDGVGIRSRASIMSYVMNRHFQNDSYKQAKKIEWLSLASGAAIPVFDAAQSLGSEFEQKLNIILVDIDQKALSFANKVALEDFGGIRNFKTVRMNILRTKKLRKKIGTNSKDAIDILGFFEYLPSSNWTYRKRGISIIMPGGIEFLKAAYSLLKPGGILVLGNMRDSHPQLQFTTQIVRWPYIRPRSLEKVEKMINEAGVTSDKIVFYQADDNVYTVAAISK